MHRQFLRFIPLFCLLVLATLLPASPAAAAPVLVSSDVITVGSVTATNANIDVPVYIRDTSGTPLGVDQPAGSKLQSYSIKVSFSPASAVASATFSRAGITAALTPSFSSNPQTPGTTSLVETYQEATNPIPFTLNGALPGNQVAHILVHLAQSATPGTVITMTIDPTLTQTSNDSGTTTETVAATNLSLVNGTITLAPSYLFDVPALSHLALALLAAVLALAAIRFRT